MDILPIFIPHLGCPNDCVFCNQRSIAAPTVPTVEQVSLQIEQGLCYSENPTIAYYGGSFTAIGRELMEGYLAVAAHFVHSGKACGIRISTRPDCIDEGVLKLLGQYGVTTIELGAQSMCDEVLVASKRGHTSQDVVDSAALIREKGFALGLQIMTGLPEDNLKKSLYSTRELCKCKPDFVRIYPVCVIEKTHLAQLMTQGLYTPLSVEQSVETAAQMGLIFEKMDIPIIRIGLNPTDELSGGAVLAGGYHPALGEMVRGRMMHKKIKTQLERMNLTGVEIQINPRDASLIRGQKSAEFKALQREFPHIAMKIQPSLDQIRGHFKILPVSPNISIATAIES